MLLGSPGSGKSTVARRIGGQLDLPVFHLDRLYHRPGWTASPADVFLAEVYRIAALPEWVIDGNYPVAAAPRLAAADMIIYLDTPRWLALARVIRRTLFGFGRQRADVADGCSDRWDGDFLRYVWRWSRDEAPRARAMIDQFAGPVVTARSKEDVARLLQTFGSGRSNG
ncbi:MAG: hypothetical protein ABIQ19_08735 [Sphingomonas sp.]